MLLRKNMSGGLSLTECPIQTDEGLKATDVAWVSHERRASRPNDPVYLVAPEVCVEAVFPSNTEAELTERKKLYFQKGALEFWLCGLGGETTFLDPGGQLPKSRLCPSFPVRSKLE